MRKHRLKAKTTTRREVGNASPPDFDLAGWEGADPSLVLPQTGNNDLAGLVLSLAVVFNDLKGISYAGFQLAKAKPDLTKVTPARAQYSGMEFQIVRWQCGLLQELMKLLQHHKETIQSAPFRALLDSLPAVARPSWEVLERIALGPGTERQDKASTAWILQRLRNHIAFHYSAAAFAKAYRAHFFETEQSDLNRRAVFADGDTMEATRFYFADAAAQVALRTEIPFAVSSIEDLVGRIGKLANEVNVALKHIVVAHLRKADRAIERFKIASS